MEGSNGRSKANAGNDWSKEASKEGSSKEVCGAILLLAMPSTWTVQASQTDISHSCLAISAVYDRQSTQRDVSLSQTEWVWNLN